MTYSDKLKDDRWVLISRLVKERDGGRCRICNKSETLHVHHRAYRGDPWEAPLDDLVTLCSECHALFHGKSEVVQKEKSKNNNKTKSKPKQKQTRKSRALKQNKLNDANFRDFTRYLRSIGYKRVSNVTDINIRVQYIKFSEKVNLYHTGTVTSTEGFSKASLLITNFFKKVK